MRVIAKAAHAGAVWSNPIKCQVSDIFPFV